MVELTVKSVQILEQTDMSANGDLKVVATMSDDSVQELFSYYSDELSFHVNEFVGMTVEQAVEHKCRRDIAYLQG
jgi:hypothetical protein